MIILSNDETNCLFAIVNEATYMEEGKFITLTEEMMFDYDTEEDLEEDSDIRKLSGYKVKLDSDGSHKNDGQMVEYTLTLISPENKKTILSTEMCLMVGWNCWEDSTIK